MRYKLLGKTGLRVSELALGTMTFGQDWGWGASQEESKKIFEAFTGAGGNFIDTACNYTNGTSEKYVGEFVKPDRDHFVVATKFTLSERKGDLNFGGNHRKNLLRTLKNSLNRLQTDYLDLLWLHMWDSTTPIEEVLRTLNDLVREGQVLHIAVSDTPAWVVARANTIAELRGWARFEALQVPYSLVNRDVERDLLPMAKAFGMSVTPWAIIAGGVLSGKYNREGDEPTRQKRDSVTPERLKIAEAVTTLAQELGRTPSQVAINWVRGQGSNIIPLLGARTEAQIRDNLGCLDFTLSSEQTQRLNEAAPINLGFPHTFLTSENVRSLVFGDTFSLLDLG
jgi:aryl-alcohol dehydrogenase-like predicted oxidoreductase